MIRGVEQRMQWNLADFADQDYPNELCLRLGVPQGWTACGPMWRPVLNVYRFVFSSVGLYWFSIISKMCIGFQIFPQILDEFHRFSMIGINFNDVHRISLISIDSDCFWRESEAAYGTGAGSLWGRFGTGVLPL